MLGDLGARGWLAKEEGLIKLVADRKRGVLVGGCVVSEAGGEILSFLEVAVHAEIPVATLLTHALRLPDLPPRPRARAEGARPRSHRVATGLTALLDQQQAGRLTA